jgi:glucokinase
MSDSPGAFVKVENMCSGFGIEKRLCKEGYVPDSSYIMKLCNGNCTCINSFMLEEAARFGDRFALDETDRIARSYAIGLSNVITLISPDCISIGGGVAKMGDLLLNPIRKFTDELVFISARGRYRIVGCNHGDNAVLVGSILYASTKDNRGVL